MRKYNSFKSNIYCIIGGLATYMVIMILVGAIRRIGFLESFLMICVITIFIISIYNENKLKYKLYAKRYGKGNTNVIQYIPPKGISPSVIGVLCDGKADSHDITCLIYHRAANGIISIDMTKQKNGINISHNGRQVVVLKKLKDLTERTPYYEAKFFESIFRKNFNLKRIVSGEQLILNEAIDGLTKYVVKMGWMEKRLDWRMLFLFILGIFIFIFCFITHFTYLFILSLGLIIIKAANIGIESLCLTPKGKELFLEINGYRNFIKSCSKRQLNVLLKDDPLFLDKTLPYAIAFGLETEFLGKITPEENHIKKIWKNNIIETVKDIVYIINQTN